MKILPKASGKLGDDYSKTMLLDFHDTIDRYLHGPPLNKGLKLSFDPRFKRRNEMLNAQVGFHKTAKEDGSHAQLFFCKLEGKTLLKLG